ncbi:MAG TPA: HNH endonuclease signature motif containing protein [Bacteroidia bacterium]|nr:HNH endonuclease signature motif containing protein [Bacteroidia bacterium]
MIEYRPILGFDGYFISNEGTVLSMKRTGLKEKKLRTTPKGYKTVGLQKCPGTKFIFFVHKLVLETFVCPRPNGMQARHLNGIASDNRLENLAWGTSAENQKDKEKHGTHVNPPVRNGEKHEGAKLNDEKVRLIIGSTEEHAIIAERLGVSKSLVSMVKNRKRWRHVLVQQTDN